MVANPQTAARIRIKKGLGLCLLVFSILLLLTWVAMALNLDIRVGRLFFSQEAGWIHQDSQPWKLLYQYGTVPGLALTLGSLLLFFLGFLKSRWQGWQKYMLVIALTSILGAGVLVNGILKPYCGRPRPREVKVFQGQWEYCAPCWNEQVGRGKSFPCGHCTMGFLFVALIYCRRKSPAVAYGGAGFGLMYGLLLGVARAAQGAHFATDTLWSLGVLVIVSLGLYYIVIPVLDKSLLRTRAFSSRQKLWAGLCTALVVVAITIAYLTRRPFNELVFYPLTLPPGIQRIVVQSNVALSKSTIGYEDKPAEAAILGQGFGWTDASERVEMTAESQGDTLNLRVYIVTDGYFAELEHQLFLTLPPFAKEHIRIDIQADAKP